VLVAEPSATALFGQRYGDRHSAEKIDTIFGMFEQADSSTTGGMAERGWGCPSASRLVGLMGGRSGGKRGRPRQSFHFTVVLDQAATESGEVADAEPLCLHGTRVLVVDDNATNRRILDEVLASGNAVHKRRQRRAGPRMLAASRTRRPSLSPVITDAHMPEIDGFMLARQIREDREIRGPVIMMLTSGDRPNDMQECERLGIGAYLLKPIKQSELLEAIELVLGMLGSGNYGPALPTSAIRGRSLRILLAEDSLVNQQLPWPCWKAKATRSPWRTMDARPWRPLRRASSILCSWICKCRYDGLEATASIRANERDSSRHLPIIAMTPTR